MKQERSQFRGVGVVQCQEYLSGLTFTISIITLYVKYSGKN